MKHTRLFLLLTIMTPVIACAMDEKTGKDTLPLAVYIQQNAVPLQDSSVNSCHLCKQTQFEVAFLSGRAPLCGVCIKREKREFDEMNRIAQQAYDAGTYGVHLHHFVFGSTCQKLHRLGLSTTADLDAQERAMQDVATTRCYLERCNSRQKALLEMLYGAHSLGQRVALGSQAKETFMSLDPALQHLFKRDTDRSCITLLFGLFSTS